MGTGAVALSNRATQYRCVCCTNRRSGSCSRDAIAPPTTTGPPDHLSYCCLFQCYGQGPVQPAVGDPASAGGLD